MGTIFSCRLNPTVGTHPPAITPYTQDPCDAAFLSPQPRDSDFFNCIF